jgi:signal transduction histidine kinase
VRPDGQIAWVIARLVPELDDGGRLKGILGTLTNITQHKQAEERQRDLEAQLQEAHKMESLGVLAAGVAHNVNNVLAIIMGTASLGEQVATEPSDQEAYQRITQACLRGRDVVRSMLHFAQPSLLVQAPFELHALIMEVRILLENSTRNAIKVSESFAREPLWINGDPGSINHALLNLCLNALGAMPGGGNAHPPDRHPGVQPSGSFR